jgi:sulfide dehydrogenase [flavocytochrome c] flavoprotein subunit
MALNRRTFLGTAAAVSATLATPMIARAQMAPKVVVVGGGAGRRHGSEIHRARQ